MAKGKPKKKPRKISSRNTNTRRLGGNSSNWRSLEIDSPPGTYEVDEIATELHARASYPGLKRVLRRDPTLQDLVLWCRSTANSVTVAALAAALDEELLSSSRKMTEDWIRKSSAVSDHLRILSSADPDGLFYSLKTKGDKEITREQSANLARSIEQIQLRMKELSSAIADFVSSYDVRAKQGSGRIPLKRQFISRAAVKWYDLTGKPLSNTKMFQRFLAAAWKDACLPGLDADKPHEDWFGQSIDKMSMRDVAREIDPLRFLRKTPIQ